jgi:hypothetical protein
MRSLLRLDFFVDAAELTLNAIDLMSHAFRLLVIHIHGSGAGQSSLCSAHDCYHHLQIPQEFGARPGRSLLLSLPLCFEK